MTILLALGLYTLHLCPLNEELLHHAPDGIRDFFLKGSFFYLS